MVDTSRRRDRENSQIIEGMRIPLFIRSFVHKQYSSTIIPYLVDLYMSYFLAHCLQSHTSQCASRRYRAPNYLPSSWLGIYFAFGGYSYSVFSVQHHVLLFHYCCRLLIGIRFHCLSCVFGCPVLCLILSMHLLIVLVVVAPPTIAQVWRKESRVETE